MARESLVLLVQLSMGCSRSLNRDLQNENPSHSYIHSTNTIHLCIVQLLITHSYIKLRDRRGRNRMVFRFTTTSSISEYHL